MLQHVGRMVLTAAVRPTTHPQVPEYLEKQDALKAAGVDEVIVYCVNDGAVMLGWEQVRKTPSWPRSWASFSLL